VPEIVIVFEAQEAETPAGNPFVPETPELAIPVALAVLWVIVGIAVLIHTVGVVEAAEAVLLGLTIKAAETVDVLVGPHPPVLETST
jgi:hypothetical protein